MADVKLKPCPFCGEAADVARREALEDAEKAARSWVAGIPDGDKVRVAQEMLKGYVRPLGGRPEDLYRAIREARRG